MPTTYAAITPSVTPCAPLTVRSRRDKSEPAMSARRVKIATSFCADGSGAMIERSQCIEVTHTDWQSKCKGRFEVKVNISYCHQVTLRGGVANDFYFKASIIEQGSG